MRYLLLIISILFVISPVMSKEYNFDENSYAEFRQDYAQVTIPKGTIIYSKLIDNINSETNSENDIITTILSNDWKFDGKLIAPEGSKITGKIVGVKNASYASGHAIVKVVFNEIIRPDNSVIPIDAKKISLTAGESKLAGTGRVVLQGAAQGARITTSPTRLATGMATGILTKGFVFVTKRGRELFIPSNTEFKIELKNDFTTLEYLSN